MRESDNIGSHALRFQLSRMQKGLEALYRVDTELDVDDFLIDSETRDGLGIERHSREQLILSEAGDVGLFICDRALCNLGRNDPSVRVDESNFADFLLAIEGVSHFVYLAWRARADRAVTGLELELQAEVDKYVTLVLIDVAEESGRDLRQRLFCDFSYEPGLSATERPRYVTANRIARRYAAYLEQTYVNQGRKSDMLCELRHFYRLPLSEKLSRAA